MNPSATNGHAFIGVEVPRNTALALEGLQHAVEQRVRSAGGKAVRIPRRILALPLDDLGVIENPAVEAAELAMRRVARGHAPFSVTLRGVVGLPALRPTVARIEAVDERDRLADLRAALHAALARYGFPVPEGRWRPHVPLCRIEGIERLPEVDDRGGPGVVRIRRLVLFHRNADSRLSRFRAAAMAPLSPAGPEDIVDHDAIRAEIEAELDARLDRRMQQLKTTRVRRKGRRAG